MGWWYQEHKPTIETDEGIKARSQRGDFAKNWWASQWLQAMERVMDRGRLQRGRSYARKGQVLSLVEKPGKVVAEVQGSRPKPYRVTIGVEPLDEEGWARVLEALAERPIFVAQLLAGEMPQQIEEAFEAVELSLFPQRVSDLEQACNCPDWAEVCKHLAAVHYILAERFDEDPFLLFRLRGRSQDAILAALGPAERAAGVEPAEHAPAPPLVEALDHFWESEPELEHFRTRVALPEEPYPVLERLGEPDFLPGARRWLEPAYDAIARSAVEAAFAGASEEQEEQETDDE
jgi:uncharacterized Zn finger protein